MLIRHHPACHQGAEPLLLVPGKQVFRFRALEDKLDRTFMMRFHMRFFPRGLSVMSLEKSIGIAAETPLRKECRLFRLWKSRTNILVS